MRRIKGPDLDRELKSDAEEDLAEVVEVAKDLGQGSPGEERLLGNLGADLLELGDDKRVGRVAAGVKAGKRGKTLLVAADLDEPAGRLTVRRKGRLRVSS